MPVAIVAIVVLAACVVSLAHTEANAAETCKAAKTASESASPSSPDLAAVPVESGGLTRPTLAVTVLGLEASSFSPPQPIAEPPAPRAPPVS